MKIDLLPPSIPIMPISKSNQDNTGTASPGDFGEMLKGALDKVNNMQVDADKAAQSLALGSDVDLHQVMLTTEKANLALQLTVQVRNKLVDAYQEISRMQI